MTIEEDQHLQHWHDAVEFASTADEEEERGEEEEEGRDRNKPLEDWETKARVWLTTLLPECRAVTMSEVENWVSSNKASLPSHVLSLSQSELLGRFSAIQSSLLQEQTNQVKHSRTRAENPARFQRTDRWLPVYTWLESLDSDEVINSKDITDWLTQNPKINEELCAKHSRYHLTHYIKKCHIKILKRRGIYKGDQQLSLQTSPVGKSVEAPLPSNSLSNIPKESDLYAAKRNEALRKYEILVELEKQLATAVPNQ